MGLKAYKRLENLSDDDINRTGVIYHYLLDRNVAYVNRWIQLRGWIGDRISYETTPNGNGVHVLFTPDGRRASSPAYAAHILNEWLVSAAKRRNVSLEYEELCFVNLDYVGVPLEPHVLEQVKATCTSHAMRLSPHIERAPNLPALEAFLSSRHWCEGAAMVFDDVAFVNQVEAGSEFACIRDGRMIDSCSMHRALEEDPNYLLQLFDSWGRPPQANRFT